MAYSDAAVKGLLGEHLALPEALVERYPELRTLRFRRGGLPLRIGGWMLGQATVAAITLGRTIFLAPSARLDPELLLHEFRHVQQFSERKMFPFHYIWQSLRRGYHANRYEADARSYAARRLESKTGLASDEDA
ncbi:MAG TPA: DUF4157 domain-containing protein [Gemmatimonadaceae bacterium]|nr:DUF4157 domain-containing protein [Gemmatimonadaceae bacterium]